MVENSSSSTVTKIKRVFNSFSKRHLIINALGVLLICLSIGMIFSTSILIKQFIKRNVIISEDSPNFNDWVHPPADLYRKYYFFHVNNSQEFESGIDKKPTLIEMGPYVYREVLVRKNIVFNGTESVTYSPVYTLFFEESLSNGSENDLITILNIPAIGMVEELVKGRLPSVIPSSVNFVFFSTATKLFVTKTVNQLLTGYDDTLLAVGKLFAPHKVKSSRFGLMNDINGSLCYNITILTGKNADVSNLSKVIAVDGLNYNKHWVHESSMPLKGSDGSQFEPYCKRERTLRIFAPDMCRSFSLEYKRDNIVENVKTYEYHLAKNIFSTNSSLNPENEGFCGQDCLGDGVFNMSQCTGMSSFISLPHFLNSDVKFLNAVNGLKPDETKHDFVYNIEPVTGVPVSVNARLQISFYLYHHEELGIVSDAKELLFPTMWIDESVILHPRLLAQFTQAANFVSLIEIVPIILILIGVLMMCITVFYNVYGYCKRNKEYSIDKITLENSTQENTNFI